MPNKKIRCSWCLKDELYQQYHDEEWGVPQHNDQRLFEMLCLEGAQAGLSWYTILKKRENYRQAFDQFDAKKIGKYTEAKKAALLQDAGIVRNRLKINAFILNAKAYLAIQKEFGSFDAYLWRFAPAASSRPAQLTLADVREMGVPPEAHALSKDLKKRGWKFVGPTTMYAFMQAMGMVDDHLHGCHVRGAAR